jgi:outer membrane protein TolC
VAAATRLQVITALRGFAERTRNAARDRFESGAAPRLEALQAELALAQADNEQERPAVAWTRRVRT